MKRVFDAVVAMMVVLSACSFDSRTATDPNKKRDQDTYNKLTGILKSIRGSYTGTLVSDGGQRTETAILRLNYYDKFTGRNDVDGQKVYMPVPTGKFILPETDDLDSSLEGSYNEVSGLISLDSIYGPSYKVQGSLINGSFEGHLLSNAGMVIGLLSLPKFTPDVETPRNEEQEQYDRRKCWLNRVVGRYVFDVTPYDPTFNPFQISMSFNLEDTYDSNSGWTIPVLIARGRRTDGMSKSAKYSVIYKDDVYPEQLSLTPQSGAVGYSDFSLTSKFKIHPTTGETTVEGEAAFPTFTAKVKAVRDPATRPAPEDCKKTFAIF